MDGPAERRLEPELKTEKRLLVFLNLLELPPVFRGAKRPIKDMEALEGALAAVGTEVEYQQQRPYLPVGTEVRRDSHRPALETEGMLLLQRERFFLEERPSAGTR
jgi:hypothetical protein